MTSVRYALAWTDSREIFSGQPDVGGPPENRRSVAAKRAWRVRRGLPAEITIAEIMVETAMRRIA